MLKVALIGTGFIATQKHLPAWRRMQSAAKIVALCDTDLQRGQEVAHRFGISKVYEDVNTILEREQPDIVDICTPPQTHAPLAVQALNGGAHVLIEKPMAVSIEECDLIIKAAEDTDRKVCVVHSDLFYPSFIKARELVETGAIGDFKGMRIFLSTPVDYITSKPDHWAHNLPGGIVGETGPHIVYLTLAFINPIQEVHIYAQKLLPEFPWSPFEDYRINLIGQNATSSVTLTYTTNQWAAQVEIWGSKGLLKVDLESRCVVRHKRAELTPMAVGFSALSEAMQTGRSILTNGARVLTRRFLDSHSLLLKRFCESIQKGEEPPVTAYEGREAVRLIDLMVERLQHTRE